MKLKTFIPGPTKVSKEVRKSLSNPVLSPDYDDDFSFFFNKVKHQLLSLVDNSYEVAILAGEAMVALDSACASAILKNDKVLILSNGVFGSGFENIVKAYSNFTYLLEFDWTKPIDLFALKHFLVDNKFDVATIVACDTPTGVTNDVAAIASLLKENNILTIVDAVSAIGVEKIDASNIDLLLGGSQKALSAPVGISFIYLSQAALKKINKRVDYLPYYLDLRNYFKETTPYTYPRELINCLSVAIDKRVSIDVMKRFAIACRCCLEEAGIKLFLTAGYSNGVTAFYPPMEKKQFLQRLKEQGFLLAPPLNDDKGIIRIGHLGYNCNYKDFYLLFKAIGKIVDKPLEKSFKYFYLKG